MQLRPARRALARQALSIDRPPSRSPRHPPALEGFVPTPEMPEIAESQALLAALAETDEVKAANAQRQRRLHLQTARRWCGPRALPPRKPRPPSRARRNSRPGPTAAAVSAQIHQDILRRAMRCLSLVGDMGSTFSARQRQRMLLARPFYRQPQLLILDDGTANLDEAAEEVGGPTRGLRSHELSWPTARSDTLCAQGRRCAS